jgi:thioredoxin 2
MSEQPPTSRKPVLIRCVACGTLNRIDLSRLGDRPRCAKCGRPILLDRPQRVTDADFQKIVDGAGVTVLVDFYADWCGPCRMMAPALDDLAAKRAGELLVLKLDTDANPNTARQFGIRGIPTLIAFREGREVRRHVGLANEQALITLIA